MFMPGHNACAPDRHAMLSTTHLQRRRSNVQDFNMLQVTFSPQGFMAAVETGLLQYVAPGHFHWKASLKQRLVPLSGHVRSQMLSGAATCAREIQGILLCSVSLDKCNAEDQTLFEITALAVPLAAGVRL